MADPLDDPFSVASRTRRSNRSFIPAARFGGGDSFNRFIASRTAMGMPANLARAAATNLYGGGIDRLNQAHVVHDLGYGRDTNVQNAAIARSIARYGANPATQTVNLPSGGTATYAGGPPAGGRFVDPNVARYVGYYGQPPPGFAPQSPFEQAYAMGFNPREQGVQMPQPNIGMRAGAAIASFIPAAGHALAGAFRGVRDYFASPNRATSLFGAEYNQ